MPIFYQDSGSFNSLLVTGSGFMTGSVNILTVKGSGSNILTVSGSVGPILSVSDSTTNIGTILNITSGSSTFVNLTTSSLFLSSSLYIGSNSLGGDGTIVLQSQGTGTPAAAQDLKIFSRQIASKHYLAQIGPSGLGTPYQIHLGRNKIYYFGAPGNSTTLNGVFNLTSPTTVGTLTTRNVATTNLATRLTRIGVVSAATAGSSASLYINAAQFSAGSGVTGSIGDGSGFFSTTRFVPSNAAGPITGERFFVGFTSATTIPTNVEPNTLTNCIGMAQLSTDQTQFYLVYGGSSAQTAIAMGTSLGAPSGLTTNAYEFSVYSPMTKNAFFYVQATNTSTGVVYTNLVSGSGTVVPQSTTLLAWRIWKTNNAAATASAFDLGSVYIEIDV
jgi:hypothetical protein